MKEYKLIRPELDKDSLSGEDTSSTMHKKLNTNIGLNPEKDKNNNLASPINSGVLFIRASHNEKKGDSISTQVHTRAESE